MALGVTHGALSLMSLNRLDDWPAPKGAPTCRSGYEDATGE